MDGRPGDDQIVSRLRSTNHRFLSRMDGLSSATGRLTWGTGQPIPARPRGKIAGRLRDTHGRDFDNACVFAYDASGRLVGSATTDTGGTYHIGRLPDGRYKVQFVDCRSPKYNSRWYKQKTDLLSADVVTVRRGGRTTGIDAMVPRG
jgi:hypothetical protein